MPGNGAAVAAVRMAGSAEPEVAGKPYRPLLDDTVARLGAQRPVFVGDRLDTDIAGAANAGLDSLLVLTGSHGPFDLCAAPPHERPTHLGYDLRALLAPALVLQRIAGGFRCGPATARVVAGRPQLLGGRAGAIEALWALAHLTWQAADQGRSLDIDEMLSRLVMGPGAGPA